MHHSNDADSDCCCCWQSSHSLQGSPDPIPDLAAAVQKGLALITTQTDLQESILAPLRADLVRCANYVCLLAWRQHMNDARRRAQQQTGAPAAAAVAAAVAEAGGEPAGQQPYADDNDAATAATAVGQQTAAVVQPAVQAAAVQTELGPSLPELQELLTGLRAVMAAPGNPSCRLSGPSLNLLLHFLIQQLQGWNLQLLAVQPEGPGVDGGV